MVVFAINELSVSSTEKLAGTVKISENRNSHKDIVHLKVQ